MNAYDEPLAALDYAPPPSARRTGGPVPLDSLAGIALLVSASSMVAATVADPGGMQRDLQIAAGAWGGAAGLLLAGAALARLLVRRRFGAANIAVAASAIGSAATAMLAAAQLYWR